MLEKDFGYSIIYKSQMVYDRIINLNLKLNDVTIIKIYKIKKMTLYYNDVKYCTELSQDY